MVIEAFWALLEASEAFTDMVPVSNRIKFTGLDRDPIKRAVSTSDLPEVRVLPVSSLPHPWRTSCSHSDLCQYEVQIATGDQRVSEYLFPLKWIVFQSLWSMESYLRENVVYESANIVRLARPVSVRTGVSQADLNRGIRGWSAIWAAEVELWFSATP